jgi:ABC-type cobalt transport system substrate-binding protein
VTGNRAFTLNLTNVTAPGRIISPSNQVVTIIDNNSGLSFSSAAYTVIRNSGTTTITVLRTDNTNQTTSVNFATLDGTAVAGTDYVATNGTFVFTNGQTSQTFQVTVIANTAVQPDKTVLLQLTSPVNGILIAPSAAVLTIHDTSGSLVVPDGSMLVQEGFSPPNGIIDPGETNTLLFAFRASAGTNIANFNATLLATNGVTLPVAMGAMSPSSLTVGGRPASQAWQFTASGTNGQAITATFQLYNGANSIGTAVFSYTLGYWKTTLSNSNAIVINDLAKASPYPSQIQVSGLGGVIIKATVTLTNLYHLSPADIDALVVAPNQQNTLIMAHSGGGNAIGPVTLTFDDAASNSLPHFTTIVTSTNKPTAYLPVVNFP